jgi:hypothetical protein
MSFGIHKGKRMTNVPGEYLLWLYEQPWAPDWPGLYAYLKTILPALQETIEETYSEGDMTTWDDYMDGSR